MTDPSPKHLSPGRHRYNAFVSYRHGPDTALAEAIRDALHRFAKPWYRLRAVSVFLDRECLDAAPDLSATIKDALIGSEYLILIASREARESKWIQREVEFWLEHKQTEQILLVVSDGVLTWSDEEGAFVEDERNPLPSNLRRAFASEPHYLDLSVFRSERKPSLRNLRFREEIATLAARLRGRSKDTLIGEDVRLYRRARALAASAVTVLAVLTVAASVAAYIALANLGHALFAQGDALFGAGRYEEARAAYVEARRWLAWTFQSTLEVDAALAHQNRVAVPPLATLDRRAAGELVATVSPDGRWVLIAGSDGVLRRADRDAGYALQELGRHADWISAIAISSNSHSALTAGRDGVVKLWDLERGSETLSLDAGGVPVWSVAFSPNGKFALSGGDDFKVRVWDLERGVLKTVLAERDHPHRHWIVSLGFSDDGRMAFSASRDGAIKIWNTDDWTYLRSFGSKERLESAAIAPNGAQVVSCDEEGRIHVWDTRSGEEVNSIASDHPNLARVVLLLPEYRFGVMGGRFGGARLALVGGRSGSLSLWDLRAGQRLQEYEGHTHSVRTLALSETDDVLVSASDDGTVKLWPARALSPKVAVDALAAAALALHPEDPRIAVSGGGEGQVQIWDTDTLNPLGPLWDRGATVSSMSISPGGASVVVARLDGSVSIGSITSDEPALVELEGKIATVRACTDESAFTVVQDTGEVTRFTDGNSTAEFVTGQAQIDVLDVSPNCLRVAVGRDGDPIDIWDAASGSRVSTIGAKPFGFRAAAFVGEGNRLLLGTNSRTIELWEVSPPRKIWTSTQLPHQPSALAVAAEGLLALAGDNGGYVHAIDLGSGTVFRSYRGHEGPVLRVALDQRGERGASGGVDGALHVWSFMPNVGGAGAPAGLASIENTAEPRWETATYLAKRGAYLLAMAFFGEAAREPHDPQVELAVSFWMTGDLERAHEEFERLMERATEEDSGLYTMLALNAIERQIADQENLHQDAAYYFSVRAMGTFLPEYERLAGAEAGVRAFKWSVDPYLDRAEVRTRLRDLAGAVADYTTALGLFPSDREELAYIYTSRAYALHELGQVGRAIADYQRAIELNPREPASFTNIGNIFLSRGDYDRAIVEYSHAITVAPEESYPLVGRGIAQLRNGAPDSALADFAEAQKLAHNADEPWLLARALHGTALVHLTMGEIEAALEGFDESVEISGALDTLVGRGVSFLIAGDWELAMADFDRACERGLCVRGLRVLAQAQLDKEAALAEVSSLEVSSNALDRADADALAVVLGASQSREEGTPLADVGDPDSHCRLAFYRGAAGAIGGQIELARQDLGNAVDKCPRASWYYLAGAGMLHSLEQSGISD